MQNHRLLSLAALTILPIIVSTHSTRAAEIEAGDGAMNEFFGYATGLSGGSGLIGAYMDGNGSAYLYRDLTTATGVITQNAKLTATDLTGGDFLGYGVGISGATALLGAPTQSGSIGATYLYRGLDTATGTVNQTAKLIASDGLAGNQFGTSAAIDGSIGIVGANGVDGPFTTQGAAYLYRGLDTATGIVNQIAKLLPSDPAANHSFGIDVRISGNIGIVGAFGDAAKGANSGAAYIYRNLDTAAGIVTQDIKLTASDGAANDFFGWKVDISGTTALVSAYQDDDKGSASGSAYIYRNLGTATGTVIQDAKLIASDGGANDNLGLSASISGTTAILGAYMDDDKASNAGAAYIYLNVDTATGTTTENVKVFASNGASQDNFGFSVNVSADTFLVSAQRGDGISVNTGNAYTGSVSSITTLDQGGASRTIDAISFTSRNDWTIGVTTDGNSVHLTTGDTANVTASGKAVLIGRDAGSDSNSLRISGSLTATEVRVGSLGGNIENQLRLDSTATFTIGSILLAPENTLAIEGNYTTPATLLAYLGSTQLKIWDASAWTTIGESNFNTYLTTTYDGTLTTVTAVPEPSTYALLGLGTLLIATRLKRPPRRLKRQPAITSKTTPKTRTTEGSGIAVI